METFTMIKNKTCRVFNCIYNTSINIIGGTLYYITPASKPLCRAMVGALYGLLMTVYLSSLYHHDNNNFRVYDHSLKLGASLGALAGVLTLCT